MGVILKDKLEDLPAAAYEFEQLLERYPDNTYRLDTYYNMYLLYQRSRQYSDAERYRQLILSNFPESKYGMAMQDPNYLENLKRMNLVQEELYDQAYTAYLNNDNAIVHQAYADMMRTYPLSKIMPKFMFIDALAYVTERNPEMFKKTIKEMLERYPETDITPTASAIVKNLNQGRKINGGSSNTRGMLWSMRLSNDSTAGGGENKEFTPFQEGRSKPQLFVLVFSTDSVSSNQLLYEVAKHNFSSFVMKDFELEQMSFSNLGLIIVKGFANYSEVEHYRGVWEKDEEKVIPPQAHYVIISQENFDLLLREGRTFEEYFRYLDELNEEKVEEQIPEEAVDDSKKEEDAAKPQEKKEDEKADKTVEPDEKKDEKPAVQPQQPQGESQLLEEARRRAELRKLEEDRKQEEARKKEEAKRQEEERKREEARQRELELLRQQEEAKQQEEAQKAASQDKSNDKKDDDNVRHLKKQKTDEDKARERQEKEAKKAEKERQKQLEREEKARQDSIKKAEKQREKELKAAEKAKEDSIKAAEKAREDLQKQKEQEKEEAAKRAEQERKDKIKAKEEARKQREQERKQRAKEREQKKKEEAKRKKEEAKARKEAAKQRQKEREEARKQRERERKEAARQREQERKAAQQNK